MQVASSGVTIETMGEFNEQEFTIGDPSLFLEYLRKTIYSNPPKAICQELISNARDAHREVGKSDKPVLVSFPNKFNPTWSVRDWGPGIDPKRMVEVFTKFGNSTKRGNDKNATDDGSLQTGGFGIGAKTPWAYTDTFTICTRAMEGDNLVERTYHAIIAENRKNKLIEMDGSMRIIDLNDPNIPDEDKSTGTTITVPVKEEDFNDFKSYTIRVCKFWDVRPELKGCDPLPEWPEVTDKFFGNGWKIVTETGGYGQGYYYGNRPYAIIDGIPYPLDTGAIKNMTDEMSRLCRAGVHLFFNVNEISVALSRESIQYDDPTQERILKALNDAVEEIKVELSSKMKDADTLWDAILLWNDIKSTFEGGSIVNSIIWTAPDGTEIPVTDNQIKGFSWSNSGIRGYEMVQGYDGITRLKSKKSSSFRAIKDIIFAFNDDGTVQPSRLKIETLFDNNPDIKKIFVFSPPDSNELQQWKDKNHLDYMNPTLLSTVEKKKKKRVNRGDGSRKSVTKVYKFIPSSNRGRWQGAWGSTEMDLKQEDGVFVEFERNGAVGWTDSNIESIKEICELDELYAIPTRFLNKKGDNWISLEEKMKEKYDELLKTVKLEDAATASKYRDYTINSKLSYLSQDLFNRVQPLLDDDDCILGQWIKASEEIQYLIEKVAKTRILTLAGYLRISYSDIGKKHPIDGLYEKYKDSYPLINAMDSYSFRNVGTDLAPEIAIYVNGKGV